MRCSNSSDCRTTHPWGESWQEAVSDSIPLHSVDQLRPDIVLIVHYVQ